MSIIPMIGQAIIWIIMFFAIVGVIGAIRNPNEGIGKEFMLAFHQLGIIFIPFAGILASVPFIEKIVVFIFSHIFDLIGADVAVAGAFFVPPDMGGYQLYEALSSSTETWMIAMFTGFAVGPIAAYSVPLGFSVLDVNDRKYFGLGIMAGILSCPFCIFICTVLLKITDTPVRGIVSNVSASDIDLSMTWKLILTNMFPIIVFCLILAILLRCFMSIMVKLFLILGKALDIAIKIVLVIAIVEYFTGAFEMIFGSYGFDPIIADKDDQFRALENAGYIATMLAGAYPMIYVIKKYAGNALQKAGKKLGFSTWGAIGIFASWAEALATFGIMNKMTPSDKVKVTAFSVCGSWVLGAHMTYCANFQPNLLAIVMIGKFAAGCIAILFAHWLAMPMTRKFEKEDLEAGRISRDIYDDDGASLKDTELEI